MVFALATKPESVLQIMARSLRLYRASFSRVFLLAILASLVAFLPRLLLTLTGIDIFFNPGSFSLSSLWLIVTYIANLFFFVGFLWRMQCVLLQTKESLADDFKIAIKKLPLIIAAALLQSALFAIINLSLGIYYSYVGQNMAIDVQNTNFFITTMCVLTFHMALLIYIYFLFIMYLPLILTENQSILNALKKSAFLVWNNWWHTVIALILPWLCYALVLMLLRSWLHIPLHLYFITEAPTLWVTILHIFIFSLFLPWFGAVLLLQLRDLERRKNV